MKKINKNYAFSLVEVLIVLMIVIIGLLGIISLGVRNINAGRTANYLVMSAMLAQEGVELVRNIRDDNWLNGNPTWTTINSPSYAIDYDNSVNNSVNSINDNGARLFTDANGFYTHTSTGGTLTPFRRLIEVTPGVDSDGDGTLDSIEVKVTVQYKVKNTYTYVASAILYDWR